MDNNKLDRLAAEQAPPVNTPTFIDEAIAEVRESHEDKPEDVATREAKILTEGSETDFWLLLKKRLEWKVTRMRQSFSARLGEGKIDLADVGVRSLIINEVADAYKEVIDLVEHAKKKHLADTSPEKGNEEQAGQPEDYENPDQDL